MEYNYFIVLQIFNVIGLSELNVSQELSATEMMKIVKYNKNLKILILHAKTKSYQMATVAQIPD